MPLRITVNTGLTKRITPNQEQWQDNSGIAKRDECEKQTKSL